MNRKVLGLVIGLFAVALLTAACTPSAPSAAPAVTPTLAAAPTVRVPTEVSPAAPTVPVIVAPTTAPTQAATSAPTAAAPTRAPSAQATPGATCRNSVTFVSDVSVPDGTQFAAGQQFTKTWRLRNSGTCDWTNSYELLFERGTNMASATSTAVAPTAPGATVDVSVPMTAPTTPGSHTGFWRLRAPNGALFGSAVWVAIRVGGTPAPAPTLAPATPATPSGTACTNNSAFVGDVTIPDSTVLTPGQQFTKTWRIRNTGTCTWDGGYNLAFERGTAMTANTTVGVPATAPGATVDISVTLTAPTLAGTDTSVWRLKAPNGAFFGQSVWAIIRVGSGPAAAPPVAPGSSGGPGVFVTQVQFNPSQPGLNEQIGFRVGVLNTTGTGQTIRWMVKVFQCGSDPCVSDDFKTSFGESTVVETTIPPGASVVETPQHWSSNGSPCTYVATPYFFDSNGGLVPLLTQGGTPIYQVFRLCS